MNGFPRNNYDVVIMGGGLAGLSLAIQLSNRITGISIAVVERNKLPVPEAAHKVGESLVELAAHYFSEVLGLKKHLKSRQLPKLGLRFFFEVNEESRHSLEGRIEFGTKTFPPSPSFQIDRGIFENHLAEKCVEIGVDILDGTKVSDFELGKAGHKHRVFCKRVGGKDEFEIECKWIVDASSRSFLIGRKLGLQVDYPHKASSAWFRIAEKIDVNEWHSSAEWKQHHCGDLSRWFSTNHLMGEGYWVWIIPLSSGSTSIGIVADNRYHALSDYNSIEKAVSWLEIHQPQCAAQVKRHLDKLQDFKAVRNYTHGSRQVYSADRWFTTGEAGVFLDPFYSPGSDYIAFSNTFITNIIEADSQGADIAPMAKSLNRLYLGLFDGTFSLYRDKYALFNKPTVMTVKYIWDTSLYWGLNCLLFTQGKFENAAELYKHYISVSEISDMNTRIQDFFMEWSKCKQSSCVPSYIDLSSEKFNFFFNMNIVLSKKMTDEEFLSQLMSNAKTIKMLYTDIMDSVVGRTPELQEKYSLSDNPIPADKSAIQYLMGLLCGHKTHAPAALAG